MSVFNNNLSKLSAFEPRVERLKTESLKNPMGIDFEKPRFSWQMSDTNTRGQKQTAYRIIVKENNDIVLWDSGKITSSKSYGLEYGGAPLSPSTRYFWNVTVWDKDDIPYTSLEEAWFETGLMKNNDFLNSNWISSPNEVGTFDFTFDSDIRLKNGDEACILFGRNNSGYDGIFQWGGHTEGENFFSWKLVFTNDRIVLYQQRRQNEVYVDLASKIDLTSSGILTPSCASDGFSLEIESKNTYVNTYINGVLAAKLLCPDARIDGFTINQCTKCVAEYRNIKLVDGSGCVNYEGNLANDNYFSGTVSSDGWKRIEKDFYIPGGTSFTAEATIRLNSTISPAITYAQFLIGAKDVSNHFIWKIESVGNTVKVIPSYYRNAVMREANINSYFEIDMGENVAANRTPFTVKIKSVNGNVTTFINGINVGSIYLGHFANGIGFRSWSRISNVEFKDVKYTVNGVTKSAEELFAFEELGNKNKDGFYQIIGAYNVYTFIIGNINKTPSGAAPMLRKEFALCNDKKIESARLYATSTGVYEAYINGNRVGDSYLNPGRTRYTDRIMYQTFDVTEHLRTGENAIGVTLGRGWWRGANTVYECALTFAGKLLIKYTDGTEKIIETNNDWSSFTDGPIRVNEIFNGEKYDARKMPGDWTKADYDETLNCWEKATTISAKSLKLTKVVAQDGPLTKIYKTIKPIAVKDVITYNHDAKVKVYDFGQNIAGIVRIKVKGNRGDIITLRHAELVNGPSKNGKIPVNRTDADGALWTKGNRGAKQTDTYILNGEKTGEIFEPSFVYHGFRYMQLGGADKSTSIPNDLEILSVEALVLSSEMEETGTFECSNKYINKYEKNSRWSMVDNYLSIPTDCPQRDERYGWLSDAHVFARTASYLMDINSFMSKFITDCNDDFDPKTALYPGATLQFNPTDAIGGWTDGGIILPYRLYQQYGNKDSIIDSYENMKAYIDQTILDATRTDYTPKADYTNGNNDIPGPTPEYIDKPATDRSDCMYGDWFAYGEHTPYVITETAYVAYSTYLFSEMARLLGNTEDSQHYAAEYEKFRTAWNREFVKPDGSIKCDPKIYGTGLFGTARDKDDLEPAVVSQGSYVIGLALGMFSDEMRKKAVEKLVELIEKENYSIQTGFLGVSLILPILTEEGYADIAYKMIEKEDFPSILWSVVNGATTTYEKWDVYTETNTTYKYTDHSLNHYSYGSVTEWLYRYVLGIDTVTNVTDDITAFKNIVLQPTVGGALTFAKGSYNSIYGEIVSNWKRSDNGNVYDLTVPVNTVATLYLPELEGGKVYLESGVNASNSNGVTQIVSEKNGKIAYKLESGKYTFYEGDTNDA